MVQMMIDSMIIDLAAFRDLPIANIFMQRMDFSSSIDTLRKLALHRDGDSEWVHKLNAQCIVLVALSERRNRLMHDLILIPTDDTQPATKAQYFAKAIRPQARQPPKIETSKIEQLTADSIEELGVEIGRATKDLQQLYFPRLLQNPRWSA